MSFFLGMAQLVLAILMLVLLVAIGFFAWLYIRDVRQKGDAILRNYPVIGHMRYQLSHLGEFFRQYFFAMDREELPFNRAQRTWVDSAGKGKSTTSAFGSTKNVYNEGSVLFVNASYPVLDEEAMPPADVTFGPDCRHPYTTNALVNVSAMSYGSLSKHAVTALSKGAKAAHIYMNTGEGGLSPYHLSGGCDVVFQMGTAKYGCGNPDKTLNDEKLLKIAEHPEVKMIEIKLAQGAKPGKGGILPAEKVTEEIAQIRGIPVHTASISPNRHVDINNNDELLDMIVRIRNLTGKPTGFKSVFSSERALDELFTLINQRGKDSAPDFITIDGGNGGTGAAPMALMDETGLNLNESLPMLINKLIDYGLRDRIKVICSGKRITPAEITKAYCIGADMVNIARGFLFSLGCIQSLKCNQNSCPTGITTHRQELMDGLDPEAKAEHVKNYVKQINKEVEMIAHSCGVIEPRQLKRHHARLVTSSNYHSEPLDKLYPYPSEA